LAGRLGAHDEEVRNPRLSTTGLALARLGTILTALILAFVLVYGVSVRTVTGRELADLSLRGAIAARPLFSGTVQTVLNVVSIASLLGAVAVVAVIALLRLARLEGLVAIAVLVGSNVSTWLLKHVLLDRPDLGLDEVAPATLNSLPSGHTTAAFSTAAAVVFVAQRQWRDVIATAGAGFGALVGVATMLAGWHRAADAVTAFLVVGAWTTAAAIVVVRARPDDARDRGTATATSPLLARRLVQVALGLLSTAAVLGLILVIASPDQDSAPGAAVAFLAGGLLIGGSAAAVTVVSLRALDLMEAAVRH
jgi:membrane-associated phospholipid phosphatase